MTAQAMLELPLDDDLFKVLSSDTRREILRILVERRMTGTELATRLNLGKPAVAEHLKRLSDADLIIRHDDPERRWVYYELSSRGRTILEPQRVRFYLVMAVAAAAVLVGVILVLGLQVWLSGSTHVGRFGTPDQGAGDAGLQLPSTLTDGNAIPTTQPPRTSAPSQAPLAPMPQLLLGGGSDEPGPAAVVYYPPQGAAASQPTGPRVPNVPTQTVSVPLALLNVSLPAGVDPSTVQFVLTPTLVDAANGTVEATLAAVGSTGLSSGASESAPATGAETDPTLQGITPAADATDAAEDPALASPDPAQGSASTTGATVSPTLAPQGATPSAAERAPAADSDASPASLSAQDLSIQAAAPSDGESPAAAAVDGGLLPEPAASDAFAPLVAALDAQEPAIANAPPRSQPAGAPATQPATARDGSGLAAQPGAASTSASDAQLPAEHAAASDGLPAPTLAGLAAVAMAAFVLLRVRRD